MAERPPATHARSPYAQTHFAQPWSPLRGMVLVAETWAERYWQGVGWTGQPLHERPSGVFAWHYYTNEIAPDPALRALSPRAYNCLRHHGYYSVSLVAQLDDAALLALRNLGPKLLAEIRAAIPYAPPPPPRPPRYPCPQCSGRGYLLAPAALI
jgi:hypothetical protein